MKKLISVFLVCILCFSLVSCSSTSSEDIAETTEETGTETVNENEDNKGEEIEYIDDTQEPSLAITLVDHDGNFVDIKYRDSGITFEFIGENQFQNGYAFIKDSKTMFDEAVFLEDGKGSDTSETIYIIKNGAQEVYISKSDENYREEGELYYIQEEYMNLLTESFIGNSGETQHWGAVDVTIYSIDKKEIVVPESTYVNMTSTNTNGEISININGNGEWIFDNHEAFLQANIPYRGIYAGWDIYVYPEGDSIYVNIRYTDTELYDMRSVSVVFEKREENEDIYSHIEIAESSTPIVFADKEMERLLSKHLNIPIGEIYKEHLELIEVIVIAGDDLYSYYTDETYFSFSGLEFNGVREAGGITSLEDLKHCTNLKELYIGINQINDISGIADLTDLKIINLTSNQISDITPLENLINLERLTLDHNNISDASALVNLNNLKLLDLGNNNNSTFDDLESVSKITSLESLSLYQNACSDISLIANLTNLEYLGLSTNDITDVSPLKDLTNLRDLYLGQNYNLVDISPLNDLQSLEFLSVRRTGIKDTSQIPNLANNPDRYVDIRIEEDANSNN